MNPDQKKHDWGPVVAAPYVDGGQCRRCGLILSCAQISSRLSRFFPECEARPSPAVA